MVRGLVEAYTGYKHNGIYSTDKLIIWFKSLKNHQFLGRLLSTWLDEVILLRSWTGFVKAKIHYLGFNLHSKYETLLRLMKSSLNLNTSSPCLHPSLEDKDNDEDGEEDLDLDHGIMVAEILLLLALIKGHPEINEGNTPSLKEITILLDHLLLNQKAKGSGNLLT
ncbi:hypothetical protein Pst134EA_005508 [Puccinia striiformis f. sp. tritici]|uniref:Uncharacterized protein n=1 Tax=Puccinia striiformis f. sp. tritici PST-78 TaxID=1165861 RepID=A0A0L0UZ08_9BASI|nr:hypothetical protein Pst134EA_005508 [Puccinia striiformis f. sp. tritici]KAH9471621.1 hypothetical protein Pst134EA_005508 [Puccinia striiformis f. sp. tritici]KNE92265.1 hypothetical protein PSTG_14359 [Puccinia striiformis f. sp. tritici PST-78]